MTFKDKPQRPGGKPARSDKKPYTGARKAAAAHSGAEKTEAEKPRKPRAAVETVDADVPQRISKILARAGVASRRDIERMIMEGRVSLNGTVLDTPVVNATLADTIEVDGQPIRGIERTRLWLYHKPSGLVTTNSDPEGRPTVFDNLPDDLPRVLSIGRLDINTEGLLLLTNDGGLARVLELPATGWLRRYRVRAHGVIDQAALDKLKDGIAVDGVLYGSIEATLDKVQGSNVWITMGLREGKNREIKNVMGALGLDVNRLIRISYGPFQLGELPEGHAQEIRGRTLRDQLGPRLIEDAKANFDAPIFDAAPAEEEKPQKNEWSAGKPEAKERGAFREKAGDKRERALSRLDTKRDDRGGGRGDRNERGAEARIDDRPKREPAQRPRKANVWMAPGARPIAEKKPKDAQAADVAEKPVRRERPEGAPATKRYGRTKDGLPMKSNKKFDPDRKKSTVYDRPDRGPRVVVNRADDDGDWIRASEETSRDEGRGGDRKRGGDRDARGFGDRPARREGGDRPPRREGGDRPFGDRKPRAEGARSSSDRPRSAKPQGDRPQGDRPQSDRPQSDRPRKPFGEKSFSREDGDRKPRDFGDRPPRGDRPAGDKPRGKSFGGKPGSGKSFGAKSGGPRGGKPGSGKPGGGKPSGGRPVGGGKPRGRGN